mmetsp:Transcript_77564/g.201890  ORF Transcript_77564/g.201890 Transcript_77564/m.201890 type:complete len:241 (-) Transcript_77564:153-875(-)
MAASLAACAELSSRSGCGMLPYRESTGWPAAAARSACCIFAAWTLALMRCSRVSASFCSKAFSASMASRAACSRLSRASFSAFSLAFLCCSCSSFFLASATFRSSSFLASSSSSSSSLSSAISWAFFSFSSSRLFTGAVTKARFRAPCTSAATPGPRFSCLARSARNWTSSAFFFASATGSNTGSCGGADSAGMPRPASEGGMPVPGGKPGNPGSAGGMNSCGCKAATGAGNAGGSAKRS